MQYLATLKRGKSTCKRKPLKKEELASDCHFHLASITLQVRKEVSSGHMLITLQVQSRKIKPSNFM